MYMCEYRTETRTSRQITDPTSRQREQPTKTNTAIVKDMTKI